MSKREPFLKPAPNGFSARYAVDPEGVIAVLYYSRGSQVSPSFSIWLVPGSVR